MDTNKHIWDTAENNFKEWLDSKDTGTDEVSEKILKATFLINRTNLRKSISELLKDVPTVFERGFRLGEEEISYSRSVERIEDSSFQETLKSDFDLFEDSEKVELSEVESTQQRNRKIVTAIISGESWPLLELYENELPRLLFFMRKNKGTLENAKDIFQDGLVILIEKLYHRQLRLTAPIESYLYGICLKLWMNHLRKTKNNISIVEDIFGSDEEINILDFDDISIDEKISKMMESLGDPCRTLLEYYYYRNMDWNKIARQLGYASAGSARNQKYKCLERIRKQVALTN